MVGLEGLAHPPPRHQLGTEEEFAARYLFLQSAQDRSTFLKFAGKVMLYQPAALLPRVMPAASQNPAEVKPPTPVLPLLLTDYRHSDNVATCPSVEACIPLYLFTQLGWCPPLGCQDCTSCSAQKAIQI